MTDDTNVREAKRKHADAVLKTMTGYDLVVMMRSFTGDCCDDLRHAAWCDKFDAADNILNNIKAWKTVDDLIPSVIKIEEMKNSEEAKEQRDKSAALKQRLLDKQKGQNA